MNIRNSSITTALLLLVSVVAQASDLPTLTHGQSMIHGGSSVLSKASGDTIDLMGPAGSGAPYIGDFESGWNGWTTLDVTQPTVTHWNVSDYNQSVAGNLAAWCGDITLASCSDSLDVVGGYGNSWHELLAYRATVGDPALNAVVNVTATLQNDTEPGYDYTTLCAKIEGNLGYTDIQTWDGTVNVTVNNGFTFLPGDLIDGTDVYVLFRVTSDGGWSDSDCSWPTAGACQIDDITVTTQQDGYPDIVSFTDFQDGTFGDWAPEFPDGVGNFAARWMVLSDLDPCATNFSWQVAFIDDGIVVPGTGGSDCLNWCYGPSGYIVNTLGGLAGTASHVEVDIISPVMLWPNDTYDGIIFSFDAYRHEDLTADSPGIFYTWGTNSADTDGSAGYVQSLDDQNFLDRNFVYYGGPDYLRVTNDVTDLMNQGRDEIQIRLGVYELGWAWGWNGNDGYPAPYFDNVSVKIFPYVGPGMSTREIDLAQDNFPEIDVINMADPSSMHVRFDMAKNISLSRHLRIDPGDSILVNIVPVRAGATLVRWPQMHYIIDANPVFDDYRQTPTSGVVQGGYALSPTSLPADTYKFDLPDSGTLFPGDVLHYYFSASDDVFGDIQTATLPADLTGFGDFTNPLAYNSSFVVHALPTITADGFGGYNSPSVLFWNDFADRGGEAEWYGALHEVGLVAGEDYDIYYTNGPSSGVGNGIGGRTGGLALAPYDVMVYTAGDLGVTTLSNGDYYKDGGDDIGALINWLSAGNKGLLLTGDSVVSDLAFNAGASGVSFSENVMGVNVVATDIRPFIANQATPLVRSVAGNGIIFLSDWIAYGGCTQINTFDAVTTRAGASRLAEFTDPSQIMGAYPYSAATSNHYNTTNKVVSLPYDLMSLYTAPGSQVPNGMSARGAVLTDIMAYLGVEGPYCISGPCSEVPQTQAFAVQSYPNPFNPRTRLDYTVPAPGHLTMKIYNVRGQLVRTLLDQQVQTSGHVMWDGTDDQGARVSSGVYFREARLGAEVLVAKMALIK